MQTNNTSSFYEPPLWALPQVKGGPTVALHLDVIKGGEHIERIPLTGRSFFVVGRQPDTCHIVLADNPSLSRQHAVLQYRQEDDGRLYVYDLKSTHGTFWNKKRIAPFRFVPLRIGDQIRFGVSSRIMVVGSDDPRAQKLQDAREVERERFVQHMDEEARRDLERRVRAEERKKERQERRRQKKLERKLKREREGKSKGFDHEDERDYSSDDDDGRLLATQEYMDNSSLFDENDDFYDRTRSRSKKPRRSSSSSSVDEQKPETLESLLQKRASVTAKLVELRKMLDQLAQTQKESKTTTEETSGERHHEESKSKDSSDDEGDSLEKFMKAVEVEHKSTSRASIEKQIEQLESERQRLSRLIEIATPAIGEFATPSQQQQQTKFSKEDLFTPDMFLRT